MGVEVMPSPSARWPAIALVILAFASMPIHAAEPPRGTIQFNRDIRPILSENCFTCHGPDAKNRKAKLRLDLEEPAKADLGGHFAIKPGAPDESEILDRVAEPDPDAVMPPPATGKKLTSEQISLLKDWIAQGAKWQGHWSFLPPRRPDVPRGKAWVRNPIDAFILDRLTREGLSPSPEADRPALLRRLSLDLIGLPPTPAEVDAFVSDHSPDAYEKQADRLLASPHYGERMALSWLDAARYADTGGYQVDNVRTMWTWRDWVIDAYNTNKPFDQFTVEQLAGDLLPNPTLAQKVATGFNRNHRISNEGGIIEEELRTEYVIDRVNTTSTVWLGLSLGCAQCHDHKYDPISQRDYYRFFAYFNSIAERGNDGGTAVPFIKVPSDEQAKKQADLQAKRDEAVKRREAGAAEVDAEQAAWETQNGAKARVTWLPLGQSSLVKAANGTTIKPLDDLSFLATGPNPDTETYTLVALVGPRPITAIRLEALAHESLPSKGAGRAFNANFVLSEFEATATPAFDPSKSTRVKFCSAIADYSQKGYDIAKAIDGKPGTGWAVDGPSRPESRVATFIPTEPIASPDGTILTIRLRHEHGGSHAIGRFRLAISRDPAAAEPPLPAELASILATERAKRTPEQLNKLKIHFRENISTRWRELSKDVDAIEAQSKALDGSILATMVMQDLPKPRPTFILKRGQYDQPSDPVEPGTPASLPSPGGIPANRLGLAKWLVSPENPLTARVAVNNAWQMHFGTGLVKTSVDFGSQGDWPSHPELLDWLATEFIATGWNVKKLHRLMVTSATYRQSSAASPSLIDRDPDNRLLARGPRFRLPAEGIRDNALAIAGLLSPRVGGPPVKPYQPAGLWEEVSYPGTSSFSYKQDTGESLYRRSLYTFWKRTVPPASLATFDAPSREFCVVSRARTNTPLQALILLNDPTYVEAARALAANAMTEARTPADRITLAFRRATARSPRPEELSVLLAGLDRRLAAFKADPSASKKLLGIGEFRADARLDPVELAAYASVASVILNLDETVNRE